VDQALEACGLADLLLAIPDTTLRRSLAVHALSSAFSAYPDIALENSALQYVIFKEFHQST
jgi:hypothetical protein